MRIFKGKHRLARIPSKQSRGEKSEIEINEIQHARTNTYTHIHTKFLLKCVLLIHGRFVSSHEL
jgi:hypothetical protein